MNDILGATEMFLCEAMGTFYNDFIMFMCAALGYLLFASPWWVRLGRRELMNKWVAPQQKAEELSRNMQTNHARGHHETVFKLWQQVRLGCAAPGIDLIDIAVDSMRRLGHDSKVIASSVCEALAQNVTLRDGDDAVVLLFETLGRDGHSELIEELRAALEGLCPPLSTHAQRAALEAQVVACAAAGDDAGAVQH